MTLEPHTLRALAQAEIDASARYRSARGLSLVSLLDQWARFAEEVAAGFNAGVNDYIYELSRRDGIEDIAQHAAPDANAWILGIAHEGDEAFRRATDEDRDWGIRLLTSASERWWRDRRPRNPGALGTDGRLFTRHG